MVRYPSWSLDRIDSSATGSANKLESSCSYFADGRDQEVNVYVIVSGINNVRLDFADRIGERKNLHPKFASVMSSK
jgi:hypothetical protein